MRRLADDGVQAEAAITPKRATTYGSRDTWFRVFVEMTQPMMSKIMVPLDGSPLAETVLPYVGNLARRLSLKVLVVRVVSGVSVQWADLESADFSAIRDEEEAMEVQATDYLDSAAEKLRKLGLDVDSLVMVGPPATSIYELAQQRPHDMIAIATHRASRWGLGSVAEALVRGTGDPVLVVALE